MEHPVLCYISIHIIFFMKHFFISGKPFPVKNCTLSNQTTSSVEVFCLPGFDGGLPQHFLLELYSGNSVLPRFNMTSYTEPYFFLDNLEPDVTFRIIIYAMNSKGKSRGEVLEELMFRDPEKRTGKNSLVFVRSATMINMLEFSELLIFSIWNLKFEMNSKF